MKDRVKSVLDRLIIAFKEGTIPKAVAYQRYPIPNIPCRKWSFLNQLLVVVSGTEDARGFRQWKEVNRFVRKGEKGFDILVPWMQKIKDEEEDKQILRGFMCKTVFSLEQTDGDKLDYQEIQLPELPLLDKAKKWGINVKTIGGTKEMYGYFIPCKKEIGLATPEEKTFFHELAHYSDHKTCGNLKNGQDPWQEIVAELSAQALCHIVGKTMDSHLGNSYEYIEHYANKVNLTPYTAILQVIGRIDKVLNYILNEEV